MKYYALIPIHEVIYGHSCDGKENKEAFEALKRNVKDPKYQHVFVPIEVVRYKKGSGLRTKSGPFEYRISGGIQRFCTIKKLCLHHIRARIDTTFNDDGPDRGNPFPRNWRIDLGNPYTVEQKKFQDMMAKEKALEERDRKLIEYLGRMEKRKERWTLRTKKSKKKEKKSSIKRWSPEDTKAFYQKVRAVKLPIRERLQLGGMSKKETETYINNWNLSKHQYSIDLRPAKVAVILTSYNRPTLVQKSINSVLQQIYKNWRLYIIDNNSHPRVKAILRKYRRDHPYKIILKILKTPNSHRLARCWLSNMINWAIRNSKEPYITLLTDDCWFHPHRLAHMVGYLDKHQSAMIIYGTQVVVNKAGKHLKQRVAKRIIPPRMGACIVDHNQIMFRRKLIAQIGFWNESPHPANINAPDAEFFRRCAHPIMPIGVVTDYNLFHGKRFQRFYAVARHRLQSGEMME